MTTNDANQLDVDEPIDHDDPEVLRRLYHDHECTIQEIADLSEVSQTTVYNRMDKFDIDRRNGSVPDNPIDHTDPDTLRRLYVDEGKSTHDIADLSAVSHTKIMELLEDIGVDRRDRVEASRIGSRVEYASHQAAGNGYMIWKDYWCGEQVSVHRLLAVAEYGYDEVADKVVHHKNNVRWDNRPENIELMTASEHAKHHTENGDFEVIGEN